MHHMVKNVFLVLMGVMVAMLFYFIFFGFSGSDTSFQGTKWKGVLWYSAEAVQVPISRYYYEFCYLPAFHGNADVAIYLGATDNYTDIQKTNGVLTSASDKVKLSASSEYAWTTGWK